MELLSGPRRRPVCAARTSSFGDSAAAPAARRHRDVASADRGHRGADDLGERRGRPRELAVRREVTASTSARASSRLRAAWNSSSLRIPWSRSGSSFASCACGSVGFGFALGPRRLGLLRAPARGLAGAGAGALPGSAGVSPFFSRSYACRIRFFSTISSVSGSMKRRRHAQVDRLLVDHAQRPRRAAQRRLRPRARRVTVSTTSGSFLIMLSMPNMPAEQPQLRQREQQHRLPRRLAEGVLHVLLEHRRASPGSCSASAGGRRPCRWRSPGM